MFSVTIEILFLITVKTLKVEPFYYESCIKQNTFMFLVKGIDTIVSAQAKICLKWYFFSVHGNFVLSVLF